MSVLDQPLSRREREVMEILFSLPEATLGDLAAQMENPPSRPALRSIVKILEDKGHVTPCGKRGREYLYRSRHQSAPEGRAAWRRLLQTFFGGSMKDGLAAYLSDPSTEVSPEELKTIEKLVRETRLRASHTPDAKTRK